MLLRRQCAHLADPKGSKTAHDCLPLSLLILALEGTRRLLSLHIRSFLFGFGSENFEASNNLRVGHRSR